MPSENTNFGQLLKDYLFFVGKTETQLSDAIGLSLNKVSAAIHGKYRLKRDYFDRIVTELDEWGVQLTEEEYAELLEVWRSSSTILRQPPDTDVYARPIIRQDIYLTPIGEIPGTARILHHMEPDPAAAARLAFTKVLSRIYDRILEQGCEPMIKAIAQRPDSPEKLRRFQALEILNRRVEQFAEEHDVPEVAASARVWTTLARLCAKTAWSNLSGTEGGSMPAPHETSVLVDFMDDAELMGILGLQAGWPPDVTRIDPDLDLPETDFGSLS